MSLRQHSAAMPAATYQPQQVQYFVPLKSVGIAYVLLLLFGFLGIHRFYLNRIGTGILYLFTFGFFFIGAFVDLFLIPSMVREENGKLLGGQIYSVPMVQPSPTMQPPTPQPVFKTKEGPNLPLIIAGSAFGILLVVALLMPR
jgi:TM2 domain-containing membrane protein YozV